MDTPGDGSNGKLFPEKKKPKTYIDQVPREKVTSTAKQTHGVWLFFLPKYQHTYDGMQKPIIYPL